VTSLPEHCRVEIIDEVFTTTRVFELPVSVETAMDSCLDVAAATVHARQLGCDDPIFAGPTSRQAIACSLVATDELIRIRYHAVGDPEDAKQQMRDVYSGAWKSADWMADVEGDDDDD